MATQLATVEHLLGVPPRIGDTRLGLADSIESGLPVSALDHLAEAVAPNDLRFKFRLIPKAKLARSQKSASRRLTSGTAQRPPRNAKPFIFDMVISKYKPHDRELLLRPHPTPPNTPHP